MYILAVTSKYQEGTKYYSKNSNTYTLLVAGVDYTVGSTITGTIYQEPEYDKLYTRPWGSSNAYTEFPYIVNGVSTLPEHDGGANDVDLDAYTNTKGKTVRNRVRHDVATLDFDVPTMSGTELHNFFDACNIRDTDIIRITHLHCPDGSIFNVYFLYLGHNHIFISTIPVSSLWCGRWPVRGAIVRFWHGCR